MTVHQLSAINGIEDRFEVRVERGKDISLQISGAGKVRQYNLPAMSHNNYLDFFHRMAGDFDLEAPKNRSELAPDFKAPYEALLTENINADILYGYGDPAVLKAGDTYYLVVTSNDAPNAFPILRSKDLRNWEFVTFVFPYGNTPDWSLDGLNAADYWAPELHRVGDEFRVYFATREKETGVHAIGMARSHSPEGPFIDCGHPLISGGVIDPHVLVDDDGRSYLYWKVDANDVWPSRLTGLLFDHPELIEKLFPSGRERRTASFVTTLWPWTQGLPPMERFFTQQALIELVTADFAGFQQKLQALSAASDGLVSTAINLVLSVMRTPIYCQELSPKGDELLGSVAKVLENDLAWEAHLIEGIWVSKSEGYYYMFYAGNDFSTADYGIGVAVSMSPFGPFAKTNEPLLKSSREWYGPGHPSVAYDDSGRPNLFLHAFWPHTMGYKEFRALLKLPLEFRNGKVLIR